MQPRANPRSRVGCWARCPIDVELQEDVDCLLALSVRELAVPIRPQDLHGVLDPCVMALIELLEGLNGTNSPRIAHSRVRTFSCDRSSRVRPCDRTKASDPSPLTTDRSSLALRSTSRSNVFCDWGIVWDDQLVRSRAQRTIRRVPCDAKCASVLRLAEGLGEEIVAATSVRRNGRHPTGHWEIVRRRRPEALGASLAHQHTNSIQVWVRKRPVTPEHRRPRPIEFPNVLLNWSGRGFEPPTPRSRTECCRDDFRMFSSFLGLG